MNHFFPHFLILFAILVWLVWSTVVKLIATVVLWDHELGLLYKNGRFIKQIGAGKHRLWGHGYEVLRYDARLTELVIQGQEIITADKATLKVTAVAVYRIANALVVREAAANAVGALYTGIQLALRQVIGAAEIDAIIEKKVDLGAQLLELTNATAAQLGFELQAVELRDVALSGDLKRAYAGVLQARKEALAELEKARGEAAALRTMANAARLFEKNERLFQLRYLQTLEEATAAAGNGTTLIMGVPEDWLQLANKK